MLRRFGSRRHELLQPAAVAAGAGALDPAPPEPAVTNATVEEGASAGSKRGWFSWKRLFLGIFIFVVLLAGGAYSQKDRIAPQAADLSRKVIGDENTARIEGWMFKVDDRADQ